MKTCPPTLPANRHAPSNRRCIVLLAAVLGIPGLLQAQPVPYAGPFPYVEDFETGDVAALGSHWEFTGKAIVTDQKAPTESGAYHLLLDRNPDAAEAVLHLNLAGQSGVTLDFGFKNGGTSSGSGHLSIRPNSTTGWRVVQLLWEVEGPEYRHLGFNLDPIVAAAGWSYTDDFQVRWAHTAYRGRVSEWYFDNVRVQVDADVVGPKVVRIEPEQLGADAVRFESVRVVFDSPLDLGTVDLDDFRLWRPDGEPAAIRMVWAIPGTEDREFALDLAAPQTQRGKYRLTVGPDLRDIGNNPMNQDQDAVNGETEDSFPGTITFAPAPPPVPATGLVVLDEGFEAWAEPADWWALASDAGSSVAVRETSSAHGGFAQLALSGPGGEWQSAWIAFGPGQLEAGEGLFLDFWARTDPAPHQPYNYPPLHIALSLDGAQWFQRVRVLTPYPSTQYQFYRLDLRDLAAADAIDLSQGLQVRLSHYAPFAPGTLLLDDLRLTRGNPSLWVEIEPEEVPENAGPGAAIGRVHRLNTMDLSSELTVNLVSDDPEAVPVPASITIATNQASATFFIATGDNGLDSGARDVGIAASAEGFDRGLATVSVGDATPPRLSLDLLRSSVSEAEGGKPLTARLYRDRGLLRWKLEQCPGGRERHP
ncbi:MAG: hypothetical protein FJ387_19275 [Verrucomicrobia bacterium]|nr:hypothetical protein [Verrucomicrobiota bacterium]